MEIRKEVKRAKEKYEDDFLERENVTGVVTGIKEKDGEKTGEHSVIVFVKEKKPESELSEEELIPEFLEVESEDSDMVINVRTDVREAKFVALKEKKERMKEGKIVALDGGKKGIPEGIIALDPVKKGVDRKTKHRPAFPGISVGHKDITAGTFGLVVRDKDSCWKLSLSNNHVYANENRGEKGDAILQPGSYDDGTMEDKLFELYDYIPIEFQDSPKSKCWLSRGIAKFLNWVSKLLGRETRFEVKRKAKKNVVDCAVGRLVPSQCGEMKEKIAGIGKPTGTVEFEVGDKVWKSGRTTGVTENGEVVGMDGTIKIQYGRGMAIFKNQIVVKKKGFSKGGDSGSAVLLQDTKKVGGLLFAGSDKYTIVNPISEVFKRLGIKLP